MAFFRRRYRRRFPRFRRRYTRFRRYSRYRRPARFKGRGMTSASYSTIISEHGSWHIDT